MIKLKCQENSGKEEENERKKREEREEKVITVWKYQCRFDCRLDGGFQCRFFSKLVFIVHIPKSLTGYYCERSKESALKDHD